MCTTYLSVISPKGEGAGSSECVVGRHSANFQENESSLLHQHPSSRQMSPHFNEFMVARARPERKVS